MNQDKPATDEKISEFIQSILISGSIRSKNSEKSYAERCRIIEKFWPDKKTELVEYFANLPRESQINFKKLWERYLSTDGRQDFVADLICNGRDKKTRIPLSKEDRQKINAVMPDLKQDDPKMYLLINLGLRMGMRIAEIMQVKASCIESNRIVVRVKGGRIRALPPPQELLTMIRTFDGFNTTWQRQNDLLKKFGKKLGLSVPLTPHVLRHTFATTCIQNNVPIETVQKALGHLSIVSTSRYVHLDEEVLEEVFR